MVIEKIKAIERIDSLIVGPAVEALKSMGPHRILIAPDHASSCDTRAHLDDPVPFVVAGENIQHVNDLYFTELGGRKSDLIIEKGHQLMEFFLRD
jgi:2,3-bisphosphoglycerate-independent phosphoglycerate mutase